MRLKVYLALLVSLCALPASAAPIVLIQPAVTNVTVSQVFSLDVAITGAVDLYAFQFDLSFTPSILSANSVTEGPFLPTGGSTFFVPGVINNALGTITFTSDTLVGLVPGVNGNGVLAHVNFTALAAGSSPIALSNVTLLDSTFALIPATTQDGVVNVSGGGGPTPVPEPSTLLFVGIGFAGLRGWRHLSSTRS